MDFILQYFASSEVYGILLLSVFIGAITQSAIGIGFGIPGCVILLFDASLIPTSIVLMGTFVAFSNAFLSFKQIIKKDLIYSLTGRVVGTLIAAPIIMITVGTKYFMFVFGFMLLFIVPLSFFKWNIQASIKNVSIAGLFSGFLGTLTGVGGPPMGIVYQNSNSSRVVPTLNMFFGFGALFSVIVLWNIGLLNMIIAIKCLLLSPSVAIGIMLGRQKFVKDFVDIKFKTLISIICILSALLVLGQAFINN
ncbi:MAG TPA: sulfite exporter TauE/SafE family protein [Candidatus Pelagibacter bacterium]|nr:sulfite exporter TauE/SafE family protein [Candidatus Pelagibacter bacterium]